MDLVTQVNNIIPDWYSTDINTLKALLQRLVMDNIHLSKKVLEPCCGNGIISEELIKTNHTVGSYDLYDRGYGNVGQDFFKTLKIPNKTDILTNPPYEIAQKFIRHALNILHNNRMCILLLKTQFLEDSDNKEFFESYPPKYIYMFNERQSCYINGDLTKKVGGPSRYAWFIWEKGYSGDSIIRWI